MTSEEGETTVATKRGKKSGGKKGTGGGKKTAARPGAKRTAPPAASGRRAAAPGRTGTAAPRAAEPTSLERAMALRDAIQRSKLTAADPWAYTAKARGWGERAQRVVDQLARDAGSSSARQALDGLSTEVERDRDFQEARRLF
jgi:hypothetical protein